MYSYTDSTTFYNGLVMYLMVIKFITKNNTLTPMKNKIQYKDNSKNFCLISFKLFKINS